jgi:hypothetical protein
VRPAPNAWSHVHGVHAGGETGEHGVAGDVGEAEREGASGEGQAAEPAEEEHGHEGPHVHEQPRADHGHGEAQDGRDDLDGRAAVAAPRRPRAVTQRGAGLGWREQDLVVALCRLGAVAHRNAIRGTWMRVLFRAMR